MIVIETIFVTAAIIIMYVYFGYPLLLWLLGGLNPKTIKRAPIQPSVSIIVAAYNEAEVIGEKIENCLSLDYPASLREIIIASDGSDDETEEIARKFNREIKILSLHRRGKINALNNAAAAANGEILVFTDANAMLEHEALSRMVCNFNDPTIGGVCGNQRYRSNTSTGVGVAEGLYWKYDKMIKRLESKIHSTVAADGSFFAIRSRLFVALTDLAQADDHAISSRVVTAGYRLILDEEAVSWEAPPLDASNEFRRKVRVANHTLGAILNLPEALNPSRTGFYAVEMMSHKVLRYAVPFLMIVAFLSNMLLLGAATAYRITFAFQILFYCAALLGHAFRSSRMGGIKLFFGPYYFCLANAAVFLGVLGRFRGKRIAIWQPRGECSSVNPRR